MATDASVIYVRLSVARERQTSLDRQEQDCRAWADLHALRVLTVHADSGRSAYGQPVRRPGLEAALDDLRARRAGTLVVWKLDRLSRRGMAEIGEVLAVVAEAEARLVAVADGIDTQEPSASSLIRVLALVAVAESANAGQRVRSAKLAQRQQGRWLGGQASYGYRSDQGRLFLVPQEAEVLRWAAAQLRAGASLSTVCRRLNQAGTPSPRGGQWGASTLLQLLRAPATAGWLPQTLRGEDGHFTAVVVPWLDPASGKPLSVLAPGEHPVLTSIEQESLLTLLSARVTADPRSSGRTRSAGYLMTGLLRCRHCGSRMSASGNSYRCQAVRTGHLCDHPAGVYIPALDDVASRRLLARLAGPNADVSDGLASKCGEQFAWPTWWSGASLAERQALMREHLRAVEVSQGRRGHRFDADARTTFHWLPQC